MDLYIHVENKGMSRLPLTVQMKPRHPLPSSAGVVIWSQGLPSSDWEVAFLFGPCPICTQPPEGDHNVLTSLLESSSMKPMGNLFFKTVFFFLKKTQTHSFDLEKHIDCKDQNI